MEELIISHESEITSSVLDLPDSSVMHWYMYPPKGSYQDFDAYPVRLSDRRLGNTVNLYIHIPFCEMKCYFCSLFSTTGFNAVTEEKYIDTVIRELRDTAVELETRQLKVSSIYIGGGTPAVIGHSSLRKLSDVLNKYYDILDAHMSVEFSPRTATPENCAAWFESGFRRASVGVQSFSDQITRRMNRNHDQEISLQAIDNLRGSGFIEVNADIIIGYEGQDYDSVEEDLDTLLESRATACTYHPLSQIRKIPQERKAISEGHDNHEALHLSVVKYFQHQSWELTSAISSSRKPVVIKGQEHHEAAGVSTLGFGAGSRTYLSNFHSSTLSSSQRLPFGTILANFEDHVSRRKKPIASGVHLSLEEQVRRRAILGLHCNCLSLQQLYEEFDHPVLIEINEKLERLAETGDIEMQTNSVKLTPRGASRMHRIGAYLASASVRQRISQVE